MTLGFSGYLMRAVLLLGASVMLDDRAGARSTGSRDAGPAVRHSSAARDSLSPGKRRTVASRDLQRAGGGGAITRPLSPTHRRRSYTALFTRFRSLVASLK